jgi:hypothetical protein
MWKWKSVEELLNVLLHGTRTHATHISGSSSLVFEYPHADMLNNEHALKVFFPSFNSFVPIAKQDGQAVVLGRLSFSICLWVRVPGSYK